MSYKILEWDSVNKVAVERWSTPAEDAQRAVDEAASQVPVVPASVTLRQAKLALALANKLADVQPIIDAMPEPQKTFAQIEWNSASSVERNNQLVHIVALNNNWTEEEVDQLFITAATL